MYQIDMDILERNCREATNKTLTDGMKNFFLAVVPYIEIAYEAGREGEPIERRFPWLKEEQA